MDLVYLGNCGRNLNINMVRRYFFGFLAVLLILGCTEISNQADAASTEQADELMIQKVELLDIVKDCQDCPPMIRIPPLLGADKLLFSARHELTWKEYLTAVEEAGCPPPKLSKGVSYDVPLEQLADNYPVDRVSVNDFDCYLRWINKKTGKHYRLPTSEEWEHLARAGSKTLYPWGDKLGFDNAAITEQFDRGKPPRKSSADPRFRTHLGPLVPVESFQPNAWGIYDVIGNVGEYIDKRKSGPEVCLRRFDNLRCERIAVRGGDTRGNRGYQAGFDWVNKNENRMESITWSFASTANLSRGFRLVRNEK